VKPAGVSGARQRRDGMGADSRSSGTMARRGSEPGQGILSLGDGPVLGLSSKPHDRFGWSQAGPATGFWPKTILE
jgi:hypothetical protein